MHLHTHLFVSLLEYSFLRTVCGDLPWAQQVKVQQGLGLTVCSMNKNPVCVSGDFLSRLDWILIWSCAGGGRGHSQLV